MGRLDAPNLALVSVREAIRSEGVASVVMAGAWPNAALDVSVQLADVLAGLSEHEVFVCHRSRPRRSTFRRSLTYRSHDRASRFLPSGMLTRDRPGPSALSPSGCDDRDNETWRSLEGGQWDPSSE